MYDNELVEYYDDIYANKDYSKESSLIETYCRLDRILDIGCGTGNHLVELYKKGRVLHGLDTSADMIAKAKEKLGHNRAICLHNLDLASFEKIANEPPEIAQFTAIISMFNVANHILHKHQLESFFKIVSRLLLEGENFIFDCFNEDAVKKEDPKPYAREILSQIKGGKYHITSIPEFNKGTASLKLKNEVDVYNFEDVVDQFKYKLDHIIWSQATFRELIEKSGMKTYKILSSETGHEATQDDYKIRFICKKY